MKYTPDVTESRHGSYASTLLRSREEILEELSRPCGRFKSPENLENRLSLFIAEHLRKVDPLGDGQLQLGNGMPLNWLRLLEYLHEQKIITEARFHEPAAKNDRPKLKSFGLALDPTGRKTEGRMGSGYVGFGVSLSTEEAMSKAVGEALERYFLSLYQRESMIYDSYRSLKQRGYEVLDIGLLTTFLPWQRAAFPEFDTDENTPFYWVWGESYPSGKKTLLPAQLVFWNYRGTALAGKPREKLLTQSTTSGCAGHFSKEEAVLTGLLEHIQRDGFLLFWLNHLSPPVLDISLLNDPEITEFMSYCRRYRLDVHFLNTTSDIGVPSVTCVVIDEASEGGPIISVGGGTGFDIKKNLIHSAMEALSVNAYTASLPSEPLTDTYLPFRDTSLNRTKRLSLWKGQHMADRFSFFLSGKKQDAMEISALSAGKDTPKIQLECVLAEFAKLGAGYEVFVYEAHDPVLDTLGFHATRTIVPQLMPLYLLEYAAPLDSRRLREVPKKLGYSASAEFNPWPHPFP